MIYKGTSVYKCGISKEDVKKMSSGWIECASKLGTKLVSSPSNFQIYINEFLLLVNVRSYVNVEPNNVSGITKVFKFNNDLPGWNEPSKHIFNIDDVGFCFGLNATCLFRYQPFTSSDTAICEHITIQNITSVSSFTHNGIYRLNSESINELMSYINSH